MVVVEVVDEPSTLVVVSDVVLLKEPSSLVVVEVVVVVVVVVGSGHACHVSRASHTMFGQFLAGHGVDGLAYLFVVGASRGYLEQFFFACLAYHALHHKLGHGAAADVTVTYKKYLFHAAKIDKKNDMDKKKKNSNLKK